MIVHSTTFIVHRTRSRRGDIAPWGNLLQLLVHEENSSLTVTIVVGTAHTMRHLLVVSVLTYIAQLSQF